MENAPPAAGSSRSSGGDEHASSSSSSSKKNDAPGGAGSENEAGSSSKARRVTFAIEPLERVKSFVYRCDSSFLVQPLLDMVSDNKAEYGFVVVDGGGAVMARVRGNKFSITHRMGDPLLPNKHRRGGQSAGRYFRNRLIARAHYVTKVTEMVTKVFIDEKSSLPTVAGIVLAGLADFKTQVAAELDGRLRRILVTTVDVSYGGTQGLTQAISLSAKALKGVYLHEQSEACADFFDHIGKGDSRAVYGAEHTLLALEDGAVETLLLWEDTDLVRHELEVVMESGGGGVDGKSEEPGDVDDVDADAADAGKGGPAQNYVVFVCAASDDPRLAYAERQVDRDPASVRVTVHDSQPLVDFLAANATSKFGVTTVRLVSDCTPEGSQFCAGFGGVGGICRWPWTAPADALREAEDDHDSDDDSYDPLDDDDDIDFDISSFA